MKKKTIIILAVILVVVAGGYLGIRAMLSNIESSFESLKNTPPADIDLSVIEDGVYPGSYSLFPVSAEVNVTVKDHAITDIELVKHDNGQGKPAEVIPQKVVESQSLDVDSVSGATHSSMVILKAIENALLSAVNDGVEDGK
ncbi:MAG: FMN-binding domain protein [Firmicutes bacterium ADurb.Bin182]|nr:MAG: FMN-binding domain protein [Firmicutes bacterium ADurb.Bin182]